MQKLQDEERIRLQERVFNAEGHFKAMCEAGGVTNQNAEAYWQRIKKAHTELVSCCSEYYICIRLTMYALLSSVTLEGHMVDATRGGAGPIMI